VTTVFNDMQAPVWGAGNPQMADAALQSRVRYTGDIPVQFRVPGLVRGPFAGTGRPFAGYPE